MTDQQSNDERSIEFSRRDYLKGVSTATLAGALGLSTGTAAATFADTEVVTVGAGSYAKRKPMPDSSVFTEDGQENKYVAPSPVQDGMYLTSNAGPRPQSNSWWSNNWFTDPADPHGGANPTVPLPWFTETNSDGLTAYYSDAWLADPGQTQADRGFVKIDTRYTPHIKLGHSSGSFSASKVDDWGDFHTRLSWGAGTGSRMDVTLVKGSPFIFAEYTGGDAEITLTNLNSNAAQDSNVSVWADRGNVLGVTISGIDTNKNYERHFGIFAPSDATWSGVGTSTLSSSLGSGDYVTIAPLPSQSTTTLDLLEDYAYNLVRDTTVTHDYAPTDANGNVVSEVRTTYEFVTEDKAESAANGSLAGLMPHQWKYTDETLESLEYWSPRGTLKIHAGANFQTSKTYPGILPHLPDEGTYDDATLQSYVDDEESAELWGQGVGSETSTYWIGKDFDHHLRIIPIAEQVGDTTARDRSIEALRKRLQSYLTVQDTTYSTTEEEEVFTYWDEFGSLIGYPAEFYSSDFVNDHHFHYGYFVKAAAELARHDGQFIDNYGDMVDLVVREFANWDRPTSDTISDTTPRDSPADAFPHLRNFDPYECHSWAAGFCLGDGNDQESSSEAMNAYASVIQWAEHRMATADSDTARAEYKQMRDKAIAVYTEEMHSIWEYWFDNDNDSHPDNWGSNLSESETNGATGAPDGLSYDAYEYSSIVWGDGYHRQTFWGQSTMEEIWGINWLPMDAHSLYLSLDESYATENWNRMVEARGGDTGFLDGWHTAAIGYRALSNPADAVTIASNELPIGRKSAHLYHWVHNLNAMGTPNQNVVADTPQAAVFEDGNGNRTYVAYNAEASTKTVTFSDGYSMDVPENSLKTSNGDVTPGLRTSSTSTDTTAPTAPTNLSSPAKTETSVDLSWDSASDSGSGVDHYTVYVDGMNDQQVAAGTTTTTVSGLTSGTTYDFAVSAVDGAGNESPTSSTVTVTTMASTDSTAPTIPSNLSSPAHTDTSVDLSWDGSSDSGSGVDHYTVYVDGSKDQEVAGGTTTATVSGLAAETAYDFAVSAVDGAGNESATSSTVTVTTDSATDTAAPTSPSNLTSTAKTTSSVDLSWDASSDAGTGVDYYTVYVDGSKDQDVAAGTTVATVSGLAAGTTYDFSVSAVDGAGNESSAAGPIAVTTDAQSGDTVSGNGWTATLTEVSTSQLEFQFDNDPDAKFVTLYYSINGGPQQKERMTDQGSYFTWTLGGLSAGDTVEYYFSFKEGKASVDTAMYSYSFGNADSTAPTVPSNLSAPATATTSVDLSWDGSSDSGTGVDYYNVYQNGSKATEVAAGTTSTTIGGLASGTAYDFAVSAVDGAGNESATSATLSVTTDSDTTAPSAPTNLASPAHDSSSVDLSWDASSDAGTGVDHYNGYVDGASSPTVQVATTSATVSNLSADTTYDFAVSAVDGAGNESAKSATLTVTTNAASSGDTVSGNGWTATLTEVSTSQLEFQFDNDPDAKFVTLYYSINGRKEQKERMTDQGSYFTWVVDGLSTGDTIEYYFSFKEGHASVTTGRYSYTI